MTDPFSTPQNRPDARQPGSAPEPATTPQPQATAPEAVSASPLGPVPAGDRTDAGTSPTEQARGSTTEQARDEARSVAHDARDAGASVARTASQEAANVKDDAVDQARRLWDETASVVSSQASDQLHRAAGAVRTFSDDVGSMARGEKPQPGLATDLADRLNARADAAATWLETHEPVDALREVQTFARSRPVAFLAIAAGIGFAAGRLTRSLAQNRAEDAAGSTSPRPGTAADPGPTGPTGTAAPAPPAPLTDPVPAPLDASAGAPGSGAPDAGAPLGQAPARYGRQDPYEDGGLR